MLNFQIKSNFKLKDVDEKTGMITGHCAVFGNIDSDKERCLPGCFDKTLAERGVGSSKLRIKHLWQHSSFDPIGVPVVLQPDDFGLYFESKMGKDSFSQDKLQQHIDGIISELSFGYNTMRFQDSKDENGNLICRDLIELKMWEYSSVTWGANSLTSIVSAKGEIKDILANLTKRLEALSKGLKNGRYTEETCEEFEAEILKINCIIQSPDFKTVPLVDSTQEKIMPTDQILKTILEILTTK
jgi:uncharacterized protein